MARSASRRCSTRAQRRERTVGNRRSAACPAGTARSRSPTATCARDSHAIGNTALRGPPARSVAVRPSTASAPPGPAHRRSGARPRWATDAGAPDPDAATPTPCCAPHNPVRAARLPPRPTGWATNPAPPAAPPTTRCPRCPTPMAPPATTRRVPEIPERNHFWCLSDYFSRRLGRHTPTNRRSGVVIISGAGMASCSGARTAPPHAWSRWPGPAS